MPGSLHAQKEFLSLVIEHIQQYHSDIYATSDNRIEFKKR